jgi:hypothetical protein
VVLTPMADRGHSEDAVRVNAGGSPPPEAH